MVLTAAVGFVRFGDMTTIRNTKRKALSREELAAELEVHTSTVDRWVRSEIIPATYHKLGKRKGRRVYFDWPAVAKALGIPS